MADSTVDPGVADRRERAAIMCDSASRPVPLVAAAEGLPHETRNVVASATELWAYRGLIGNLAQRELKVRYKRSVLGWLWSLINPASTLLIYSIVFGQFLRVEPPVAGNGELRSFALYLFTGLVVWNAFSNIVTGAMGSLLGAGPLLRKVYFPAEAPATANTLAVLTQTIIEAVILLAFLVGFGNVSWHALWLPYILTMLTVFALGIGLVLSLLNVYFRDVGYLTTIVLNMLFYVTPIIYTFDIIPERVGFLPTRTIVTLNPLTQFVGAARDSMYLLHNPSAERLIGLTATSLLAFAGGWALFARHARNISEEL
jgi:ABC-2 type transport system permease protein